jgi:hypothetical protein
VTGIYKNLSFTGFVAEEIESTDQKHETGKYMTDVATQLLRFSCNHDSAEACNGISN